MNFQITNTNYGIKNILLNTINKTLFTSSEYKKYIIKEIEDKVYFNNQEESHSIEADIAKLQTIIDASIDMDKSLVELLLTDKETQDLLIKIGIPSPFDNISNSITNVQIDKNTIKYFKNSLNNFKSIYEAKLNLLERVISNELINSDIEILKNELPSNILFDSPNLDSMNTRELLQFTGNFIRKTYDKNIILALFAIDLIELLRNDKQDKLTLKTIVGGAGTGKDTFSKYFFDTITDVRTTNEINFLINLNSIKSKDEQIQYLEELIQNTNLITTNETSENRKTLFENIFFEEIKNSIKKLKDEQIIHSKNSLNDNHINKSEKLDFSKEHNLFTFIKRPILSKDEFSPYSDFPTYKEYITELEETFNYNKIPFNEKNKVIYGFIRKNTNVHHFTEKINQVINLFILFSEKTPGFHSLELIKEELDSILEYSTISEEQIMEFNTFFSFLIKNPNVIEVIINKDINQTKEDILEKNFENAISNTKNDFNSFNIDTNKIPKTFSNIVKDTNIYFDFDDVIVSFVDEWIIWVNSKLDSNYKIGDIKDFWFFNNLELKLRKDGKSTNEINTIIWDFLKSDVYQDIEKHMNIINIIEYLKNIGFNVKILSAGGSSSKERFVRDNLPFLDPQKDLIITADKSIVKTGILIDDGGHNVTEMVENDNKAFCIVINTGYNETISTGKRITRIEIKETHKIIDLIFAKSYANEYRKNSMKFILEDLGLYEDLKNTLPKDSFDKIETLSIANILTSLINEKNAKKTLT